MGAHRARGRHRRPGRRPLPAPTGRRARHAKPRRRTPLLMALLGALLAAAWTAASFAPPEKPAPAAAAPPTPGLSPPRARVEEAAHRPPPPQAAARPPGEAAAAAALSKRGTWYVWGAKGPDNFDCSGLTQWAWRQAGVELGEDTYTQVRQGEPVDYGQPVRTGDLIFPTQSFDGRGPSHVMLAVSPSEVVEAHARGTQVRTAPLPDSYVARRPG